MTTTVSDIEGFIQQLNLPQESKVLFRTFGDCHSFYITCYGRNKHVADDLLDYREKKLKECNVSFDKFVDMCYNVGIRVAFEHTFLQQFDDKSVAVITKALYNEKVTLEDIYIGFQKNPNKNILKYVL